MVPVDELLCGEMGACMGIRRDCHMGAVARREVAACMGIRDGSRIWNKGRCLYVYELGEVVVYMGKVAACTGIKGGTR